SYTFSNISANHSISATFSATTFTVTASAGTHGSITPSGSITVAQGDNRSYTIIPDSGYHVADVLVDGQSQGVVTSYTFSNVSANHSISATFSMNTFTVTASAGSHGSITPSGSITVAQGGNQPFTITPDAGYHVSDVLVDGQSQGAVTSYAFSNIAANHSIVASFVADTSDFTVTASAGANGSIIPSGSVTVAQGGNQAYTITPDTDYMIQDLRVDGISLGALGSYSFTNVQANHTIQALFVST
ncbi:MAG: hypothetical protein GY732_21825, partial [Gammaproteobacteria bacterium]|nr:hypothetical protein [Gammaproteobacteria bacterium]